MEEQQQQQQQQPQEEEAAEPNNKRSDGSEWPVITDQERRLYELLFYSQGPVDGYLLGECVRDLLLKSGLSLRILSQIWNLADVSHDNVLNVHEFSLVMHLIRGQLRGLKAPPTLPRKLTPPKTSPLPLPPITPGEREVYASVFRALDVDHKGFLDGPCCRQVFETSELTSETLRDVYELCDVTRQGRLGLEEFCVACHLLRYLKTGHSISGPVDVFAELPSKENPQSLRARKRRVQQYEQHKQSLMALKEKRRQQVTQENKRLQLQQEKLDLLRQVYKEQKNRGVCSVTEEQFSNNVALHKEELDKLEEIVHRLKKEHEKVRQETVRVILAEQKLNTDIVTIKKNTDELNKRLATCHTHATKDPDPFHQLYEQRKEKRQGSTIKDLDKIEVSLPFTFNPFDPDLPPEALGQGALQLFSPEAASKGNNHHLKGGHWQSVMERLAGFGEGFQKVLESSSPGKVNAGGVEGEEDAVFKEVSVSMDTERWLGFQWGPEDEEGVLGLSGEDTQQLQEKLLSLRAELRKLNESGTRLLFKNPEDYLARKRAREEEEKEKDRSRFQRRSLTERRTVGADFGDSGIAVRDRTPRNRHSYTERNEQVSQAVREYRQKRQSLHRGDSVDSSASSSPREIRRTRTPDPDLDYSRTTHPRTSETSLAASQATLRESTETTTTPDVRDQPPEGERSSRSREQKKDTASTIGVESVTLRRKEEAGQVVLDFSSLAAGRVAPQQRTVSRVQEVVEEAGERRTDSEQSVLVSKRNENRETQPSERLETRPTTVVTVNSHNNNNNNNSINSKRPAKQPEPKSPIPDPVLPPASTSDSVGVAVSTASTDKSVDPASAPKKNKPEVPAFSESVEEDQRPTSPPRGINKTRPSSKKTRAPPPPPVRQASSEALSPTAEAQIITQSSAVSVQAQQQPARPKRRKDSGSGSNPSSPRDAPQQQAPQLGVDAGRTPQQKTQKEKPPETLLPLTENVCLEEEAPPPAQGSIALTGGGKKPSGPNKDKPAPGQQARNAVPPLLLNGQTSQASQPSSQGSQKRRKGKAPVPPSSSAENSPRDAAPLSPSFTSSTPSPRDAPPSLTQPPVEESKTEAETRVERRKSSKAKAPPPPQPANKEPTPAPVSSVVQPPEEAAPETVISEWVTVEVPVVSPPPLEEQQRRAPDQQQRTSYKTEDSINTTSTTTQIERNTTTNNTFNTTTTTTTTTTSDFAVVVPADNGEVRSSGRASETSSISESDAESLPPPLPSSAPPPLPSLPPPSPSLVGVAEEEVVVEVREVSSTLHTLPPTSREKKREQGVMMAGEVQFDSLLPDTLPDTLDDPQKSMADLMRAEFFGLNSGGDQGGKKTTPGVMNMDMDELGAQSADSDMSSDDRGGVEGTFSPGDSGVVLSSLPTSPDDSDSRIQLLSYTSSTSTSTQPHTSVTSTTTDTIIMSSSSSSSSSQRPQSLDVNVKESTTTVPSGNTPSPTTSQQHLMSAQEMAALSPRSREIFEKARHFADMVQPTTKPHHQSPSKRENSDVSGGGAQEEEEEELGELTLTRQDLEMERRAVISQSTPVKKKQSQGVGLLSPTTASSPPPEESTPAPVERSEGVKVKKEEEVMVVEDIFVKNDWMSSVVESSAPSFATTADSFRAEIQEPQPPPSGGQKSGLPLNGSDPSGGASGVAEVGWGSKDSHRVNLYSENVVKESDSTEVVDRESIANLASTRGKWEAIFTADPRDDQQAAKPSKPAPKWQVRMPYTEKRSVGPDTVTSNNLPSDDEDDEHNSPRSNAEAQTPDMESAIEREIRLAMEREEMLRREQEQRLRQLSQQASAAAASGGKGTSSMESSTESELQQPSFHELTEADRGAPFYLNNGSGPATMHNEEPEGLGVQSPHKGLGLQKGRSGGGEVSATESIIEREIRLQREREAELALQRGSHDNHEPPVSSTQQQQHEQQQPLTLQEEGGMRDRGAAEVEVEEIPYEEAISRYNHDGESRIAQELREVREREEEVRRLRERMNNASITTTATQSSTSSSSKQPPSHTAGSRSTPTTPRGGGMEKTPTVSFSTSRSVHSSPRPETTVSTPSPSKAPPKVKPETPIEREIRLARERENELRRSKGMPELKPEPQKQESVEVDEDEGRREGGVVLTPRHYSSSSSHYHPPPDNTMRRFASNRLQQEMQVQRDREMMLRQEGKIISTSEEHIMPGKYAEVVGQGHDHVDGGVVKRNFRVNTALSQRRNSNASQDSNNSGDGTPRQQHGSTANTAATANTTLTPRAGGGGGGGKKAGTGAVSFSYREFAQTAESKIERELREMREREEELRKQRSGGAES